MPALQHGVTSASLLCAVSQNFGEPRKLLCAARRPNNNNNNYYAFQLMMS